MNNPINRQVFDSRDLIKYREYLESELVDNWNEYIEDHNLYQDEEDQIGEVDDFDEVDLELEGFRERFGDEIEEYEELVVFIEELEGSSDFIHGETIIHEEYWEEYCEELTKELGDLPQDLPAFIENNIDWNGVAEDLAVDYFTVTYQGYDYYIRGY